MLSVPFSSAACMSCRSFTTVCTACIAQVMMLPKFNNWPSAAITVEFWMWTVDTCRWGSPISYAAGSYESADNTFLLFNYNDWCAYPDLVAMQQPVLML